MGFARVAMSLAVTAGVFSLPAAAAPRVPASALSSLERSVLVDVNTCRAARHLPPLRLSIELTRAARAHSTEMAQDGFFAHASADGSPFWRRLAAYYHTGPGSTWEVGENLLWRSPDVDGRHALAMWLASPEHRRNLLSGRWREIGVAAVHVAGAPGIFDGRDVTIVTADFGVRR